MHQTAQTAPAPATANPASAPATQIVVDIEYPRLQSIVQMLRDPGRQMLLTAKVIENGMREVAIHYHFGRPVAIGTMVSFEDALLKVDSLISKQRTASGDPELPRENIPSGFVPGIARGSIDTGTLQVDQWLIRGFVLEIFYDLNTSRYSCKITGKKKVELSEDAQKSILESGIGQNYRNRAGYVYKYSRAESETGRAYEIKKAVIERPRGLQPSDLDWEYRVVKTGYGNSVWKAIDNALAALEIEVGEAEKPKSATTITDRYVKK